MPHISYLECFHCKKQFPPDKIIFWCDECGGSIVVHYKEKDIKNKIMQDDFLRAEPDHWKYWMFYPITNLSNIISLDEGGTPLVPEVNNPNMLFKFEGVNPTGSFKDRGSSVEITHAKQRGIKKVICASTGNMGASVSAYSARAGIKAEIYVPLGATITKKKQIHSYGAKLHRVFGDYTKALNKTKELWLKKGIYLTGDYLYRQEGQKSVAFEILDQLKFQEPKQIILPIGMGNLCYATYKALVELKMIGLIAKIPKIIGVQSNACNPVDLAFKNNLDKIPIIKNPKTIASAISCGAPNYGEECLYAIHKSKGETITVTDNQLRNAKAKLAHQGLYVEASGAAPYAAALKLKPKSKTVMILTGHGLKDTMVT